MLVLQLQTIQQLMALQQPLHLSLLHLVEVMVVQDTVVVLLEVQAAEADMDQELVLVVQETLVAIALLKDLQVVQDHNHPQAGVAVVVEELPLVKIIMVPQLLKVEQDNNGI